jgi:hypothetical protein
MSPFPPTPGPPNVPAGARFEDALFDVSDFLADARQMECNGKRRRAEMVYALAEDYALRSGFIELVHLVWEYAPVNEISRRRGVRGGADGDAPGMAKPLPPAA